jgi:TonB family protein
MTAVTKIDYSVVELRTDVGRLYVRPTTLQRLYLQWTFRNFHTLPQAVLNSRQRRLIDKLWRAAIVTPSEAVPPEAIIGVVENMRVLALPSTAEMAEAAKAAKPAIGEAKLAAVRQDSEDTAAESGVPAPAAREASEPPPPPNISVVNLAASADGSNEEPASPASVDQPGTTRAASHKLWWTLGSATIAATLLLAVNLVPLWRSPQITIVQAPAPQLPPEIRVQLEKPSTTAAPTGQMERGLPTSKPVLPVEALLSSAHKTGRAAAPARSTASAAANPAVLPQLLQAPQAGFIYPIAPDPNLVGKVVLKAVVGSDGAVKQVEVLSGDRALAAAAARAVRHWRYTPVEVQGRPVEAETHVTVSFLGDDAVSIILPRTQ